MHRTDHVLIDVLPSHVQLGEQRILGPAPPSDIEAALGKPDRIVAGKPLPRIGHPGNTVQIYDRLGLYFIQHYKSGLILSMTAVFKLSPLIPFPPKCEFVGKVRLQRVNFNQNSTMSDLIDQPSCDIRYFAAGIWSYHIGHFHLSFQCDGGGNRKTVRVARPYDLSVGLEDL